jgi:hypothetical protein
MREKPDALPAVPPIRAEPQQGEAGKLQQDPTTVKTPTGEFEKGVFLARSLGYLLRCFMKQFISFHQKI